VAAWAQRLGFRRDQLGLPLASLSGGEQARVRLAAILTTPADVLLLDEPTNDLDIEARELLEEGLAGFAGAVVLVTHDRFLLDRFCNRLLGWTGNGQARFFADLDQYLQALEEARRSSASGRRRQERPRRRSAGRTRKLSYLEQREYDGMEDRIVGLEARLADVEQEMAAPEATADAERLARLWAEREALEREISSLYDRWQELEAKRGG